MARRKKKTVRTIYQSIGPLPPRIAERYVGHVLVFSDASKKRNGGLAAVMFRNMEAEAVVVTQTVALAGSNELEFEAALFALVQANLHFPGQSFALFTDNQDAAVRFNRAKSMGLQQDVVLKQMLHQLNIVDVLEDTVFCWIKGHSTCRGNTLADQYAGEAAS